MLQNCNVANLHSLWTLGTHTCTYTLHTCTPHTTHTHHTQIYKFTAEDLVDLGHLGDGAYGTVSKVMFPPTKTEMAVKVSEPM